APVPAAMLMTMPETGGGSIVRNESARRARGYPGKKAMLVVVAPLTPCGGVEYPERAMARYHPPSQRDSTSTNDCDLLVSAIAEAMASVTTLEKRKTPATQLARLRSVGTSSRVPASSSTTSAVGTADLGSGVTSVLTVPS